MSVDVELPTAVARMLAATDAEDRDAFIDAFAEDGGGTFTTRLRDGRIGELLIRG